MRELLTSFIVARYKGIRDTMGFTRHALDEVGTGGVKHWSPTLGFVAMTMKEVHEDILRSEQLQNGEITIEQYLEPLTDFQIILCFQQQCCLQYR